jgi:DNA polymerase-3 subunit delta'
VLILIGNSAAAQLPTIRSRCQIVRFEPLPRAAVAERLIADGVVEDRAAAERLAALSGGSLQRASELAISGLDAFRDRLLAQLAVEPLDTPRLTADISEFVDEAGREAPKRRARLRQVIGLAIGFYRGQMRHAAGMPGGDDLALLEAAARSGRDDPETSAKCIERCLEALEHVDRNANQATMIECWIDDLGQRVLSGA